MNAHRTGLGWAVVALAVLACGCILLVSPDAGGEHCHFAAEDSTCGSCIKARCQDAVDKACRAGRDNVLANVDGCTTARDARCTTLLGDTSSAQASELATCVRTACPGACAPAPGTSTTRCIPEPFGDGRACSCSLASPANTFICAEAALRDTICCAPLAWPGAGLSCSCQPLGCASNKAGCACFLSNYAPESEVCTGMHCCATPTSCTCSSARDCRGEEHPVDAGTCTIAEVACGDGQKRVPSCSMHDPP